MTTNYKVLDKFSVVFNDLDLPHLMGWHKLYTKNIIAKKIVNLVKNGELTYKSTKNNPIFKSQVKDRIINYNFIHEVFLENSPDVCVMTSSMKPNPLILDIVFSKDISSRKIIILGLRRKSEMDSFVPTTLHTELRKNNPYLLRRKTKVTSIKWD